MSHIDDASTLAGDWWKSSRSDTGAQCVEFGIIDGESVAVRDSKIPNGPALLLSRAQVAGFVEAVSEGRFDQ
ncbi:DUF397 domain-containing protein [Streptomyces sp. NPDC048516]|uniref:DUF397 domain-containing protein n=1 Tax=Streptomyces sp. NPDC048516 TaxID=3365565 RepID=UPI00371CC462